MGCAGGEVGGLQGGPRLPYGFQRAGWAGEQPVPGLGTSLLALTSPWQPPLMLEARAGSFPSHVEWGEDECLLLPVPGEDGCLLLPVPGGCRESWGWQQQEHSSGRQETAQEMSERAVYGLQDRSESPVWAAQAGPAGLSLESPRLDGSRVIPGA